MRYPRYSLRGSMLGRINDRRVVPSAAAGLPRAAAPAASVAGALARLTGGARSPRSVSLTRLTGNAFEEPEAAEVSVPQAGGTDSAPTVAARPIPADTDPPS